MSGGLLDRVEVEADEEPEPEVDVESPKIRDASEEPTVSLASESEGTGDSMEGLMGRTFMAILLAIIAPFFVVMWLGISILDSLMPLILLAGVAGSWLWLGLGDPREKGTVALTSATSVVLVALMLTITPFLLANVITGTMSFGGVEFSDDGDTMNIKIRQNGGSGSYDATVSISQGDVETYSGNLTLTFDSSDGLGDYGEISIQMADFYSENALPSSPYSLSLTIAGQTWDRELDMTDTSRTITAAQTYARPVHTNCEDSTRSNCLQGVILEVWAGLGTNVASSDPSPLTLSEYQMDVSLLREGSVVLTYPSVSVEQGAATWSSSSGVYGDGSGAVIDLTSKLILEGSATYTDSFANSMTYVPADEWSDNDVGCYELSITVTQSSPWSDGSSVTYSSYYDYTEETEDDNDEGTNNNIVREEWDQRDDAC